MKKIIICCIICILSIAGLRAQGTLAFPGAEGGGAYTTGGRGGKVFYVNSLSDEKEGDKETGEGTLRWCLDREGPKTILFKVAGIIHLKSPLAVKANTTIAGQSAPGNGICIAGNTTRIKGDNVIIRFLRFRLGDLEGVEDDSLQGQRLSNIIIDHCSMSWSTDEVASFYDNTNFTMQWCFLYEALTSSVHQKGRHGYGGIWGGKKATFHHNLIASNDSRNPRMCGSRYSNEPDLEMVDFRNNVIFNWGKNSGYAGEGGRYNIVNNYYKPGKDSYHKSRIFEPYPDDGKNKQEKGVWGSFYVDGNYIYKDKATTADNSLGFQPKDGKAKADLLVNEEFDMPHVTTHWAEDAFDLVLQYGGASFKRDPSDTRIALSTKNGTTPYFSPKDAKLGAGLIDSQTDVGSWDTYSFQASEVPVDSDKDGIPDGWLDKNYPGKKSKDLNEDGYTYLEVYLNSLVNHIAEYAQED